MIGDTDAGVAGSRPMGVFDRCVTLAPFLALGSLSQASEERAESSPRTVGAGTVSRRLLAVPPAWDRWAGALLSVASTDGEGGGIKSSKLSLETSASCSWSESSEEGGCGGISS